MTQQQHSADRQEPGAGEPTGQQAAGPFQQPPAQQVVQQGQGGQRGQAGQQGQGRQPQQGDQFQQSMAGEGMAGQRDHGQRFKTRNSLPQEMREFTCEKLNQILADTTDLRTQVAYAHWNVKGMNFYQFHELFEELAAVLAEHEDAIAERITALGGQARGTVRQAARRSRIPEMPTTTTQGRGFLQQLTARLAAFDTSLYHEIRAAESSDDLDTADMLNEISREVSHYLWLLEAHLQGQPQGQIWGGGQGQPPQH